MPARPSLLGSIFLLLIACDADTGRNPGPHTTGHIPCVAPPLVCPEGEHAVGQHICGLTHRDEWGYHTDDGGTHWLMPAGTAPGVGCAVLYEWCHPAPADSAEHRASDFRGWLKVPTVRRWESLFLEPYFRWWSQRQGDEIIDFLCCREQPEWVEERSVTPLDSNGERIREERRSEFWTCPGPPPPPDFDHPPPVVLPGDRT